MRVTTPDPLVSAIGDRVAASKLGRAAATHSRPPITFHPRASMRRRPRCSSNRSESRPNHVMQALSERYQPLSGDRCSCRGAFIERRPATNWAPISHRIGEKQKVLKRYHRRSASKLAARRRRSAADAIRRPDAGIESEKKPKCPTLRSGKKTSLSKRGYHRDHRGKLAGRWGSLGGRRDRPARCIRER